MTLRFGIIGCGMIARFHARALHEVEGAELAGCVGRSLASASRFAESNNCRPFGTLEELLRDETVDGVCICTPSGAHLNPAVQSAQAGKHVVVEKPLEITPGRCDQIIDACDRAGVSLATIFQSRFHDASRQLKHAVEQERFGRLAIGSASVKWFRNQQYYDSGVWRGTWNLDGGGVLMNQAIHNVDLLQWMMGPVDEVSATASTLAHERIEVEDTLVAWLRFANGALGAIQATTAAWPGWQRRLELCGTTGSAMLEDENLVRWEFESDSDSEKGDDSDRSWHPGVASPTSGGATDPADIGHTGHTRQLQDFVDSIENGTPPAVDGHEARKSVAIISAIYESVRENRPVRLTCP